MRNVLKKLFYLPILPFVLLWRAVSWPFRSKIEARSAIELIADAIEEEDYSDARLRHKGAHLGRYSIGHYGLSYAEYKKANPDKIRIRSWSSMPDHSQLIRNRWQWRMGVRNFEEAEDVQKVVSNEKAKTTD